jgi:hypothetical protein
MAQVLPNSGNPLGGGLGNLAKMFGGMMSGGAAAAPQQRHHAAEIEEIFSEISDNDGDGDGDSVIREAVEQRNSLAGTVVLDDV